MSTGLCRSDALAVVVAQLDGGGAYTVDVCDEPASHRVIVRRAGDGLDVEVAAELCDDHEHEAAGAPGYLRSLKLRT